jgi:hypothetical protein
VARAAPSKFTTELLLKPVPVTVKVKAGLPTTTALGDKLTSVGEGLGSSTVKGVVLVAVPPGVVIATAPEVALAGTSKLSVVAFNAVKLLTGSPLRVTAVASSKLVPVTVTMVPATPLPGVKLTSVGTGVVTCKGALAEVPPCPTLALATVTP